MSTTEQGNGTPAASRVYVACLFALPVGALALLLPTLGVQEFWLDELHTLLNSAAHRADFEALPTQTILRDVPRFQERSADSTLAAVWSDLRNDSHPPLYFLLMNLWRRLAGDGEFAARLPAAGVAAAALIPLAMIFREFGRPWTGLAAAALLGAAHAQLNLGQQARQYSLAQLWIVLAVWSSAALLMRWSRLRRGPRLALTAATGATLLAAMLTHYFAALPLAGLAAFMLTYARGTARRAWCIAAVAAAGAFGIIWGPSFVAQWAFIGSQAWLNDPSGDGVRRTLIRALNLPLRLVMSQNLPDYAGIRVWAEGLLVGVGTACGACIALLRGGRIAVLMTLLYVVPLGSLVAMDLATGKELLTHLRYGACGALGLTGLLTCAGANLPRRAAVVLAVVLAGALALTIQLPATDNPHSRQLAKLIGSEVAADHLVVFEAIGWIPYWPRRDLLLVTHYLNRRDPAFLMLTAEPDAALREQMAAFSRIYVVSPNDRPERVLPAGFLKYGASPYIPGIGKVTRCVRRN